MGGIPATELIGFCFLSTNCAIDKDLTQWIISAATIVDQQTCKNKQRETLPIPQQVRRAAADDTPTKWCSVLSARGAITDPGSIPGCITNGHDWESHRAVHNWPSVVRVRVWPGQAVIINKNLFLTDLLR